MIKGELVMPNHVSTRCIITGPEDILRAFISRHITLDPAEDEEVSFDFATIIPRPAVVESVVASSTLDKGLVALGYDQHAGLGRTIGPLAPLFKRSVCDSQDYPGADTREKLRAHLEQHNPDVLANARRAARAIAETGYRDWYHWSIDQWGTKWNSYEFCVVSDAPCRYEFVFDTAWSFPEPIFRQLAILYPSLIFAVKCIDEGMAWGSRGEFNGRNDFQYVDADEELSASVFSAGGEDEAQEAEHAAP